MKTTMKKTVAILLALLLVLQIVPVMADDTASGAIQIDPDSYREKLTITADSPIMFVGDTMQIKATEKYDLTWSSDNEEVATVDENGVVTALAEGTVTIKAEEGKYSDTLKLKILAVEEEEKEPEEAEEKDDEPADEPEGEEETKKPAASKKMVIVINVEKEKLTYDGEDHTSQYTAVSNSEDFDPEKVKIDEDKLVTKKDCGTYPVKYEASDFSYEGNPDAEFVVSDGWMQIKPLKVTVKADDKTYVAGEEAPEFTATVTGLLEGEDPSVIQYTFDVYTAGEVTYIVPVCEQIQGNYRVATEPGILIQENGVYRAVRITSDWPEGEPAYAGTMITMTAELIGFENIDYTLQWQHSTDLKEWTDEPGATDTTFTFELNETTVQYTWRVVAKY